MIALVFMEIAFGIPLGVITISHEIESSVLVLLHCHSVVFSGFNSMSDKIESAI